VSIKKPTTRKKKPISTKKILSVGQAQTMNQLLKKIGYDLKTFKRGDLIEGVIVEKTKKALYLDIGGKSEGMVIDREMKAAKDFISQLKEGDTIKAIVTQPENDRGQTLLSLKQAAQDFVWQEFEEKLKTQEAIKVFGKEVNKGGLIVEVKGGVQGFIPASQISSQYLNQVEKLVEKAIEVKVIEVDREKNRLILSEKEITEADLIKEQKQAIKKIKVGDELEGKVVGLMPFGLFVKAGEAKLEGLVHISEISWEKVDDPSQFYKTDDKIKIKVLAIDEKLGKLNLSIKQLTEDPWKKIEKKYPKDAQIKGEVIRVAPFGVFVALESGIEGLIHVSKLPTDKTFKEGSKVSCFVESINLENRKLSLGLVLTQKPVGYK